MLVGTSALLIATSLAAVLVAAPPASGVPDVAGRASCASFEGPFPAGPFLLSGCSDVGSTGRSGTLDNRTGVITWATGKTTAVSYQLTPVTHQMPKRGCPPTSAAEFKLRGTVTADTTGSIEVGGPVVGKVCARENGVLGNVPGTRLKIL